jgi:hypothetical protein
MGTDLLTGYPSEFIITYLLEEFRQMPLSKDPV